MSSLRTSAILFLFILIRWTLPADVEGAAGAQVAAVVHEVDEGLEFGDDGSSDCAPAVDCNKNGVDDGCDIAGGTSADLNANGVPDECQPHLFLYVDASNCPGAGDGSIDSPFCFIQDAIDSLPLTAGDNEVVEIVLTDGIYTGARNKNLDYDGRAVTVRSANGRVNCVIDMEGDGRGFCFHSHEPAGARVEGLTIQNGWVDVNDPYGQMGGAILVAGSSPTLVNCAFTGNSAFWLGGALFVALAPSPLQIVGCEFRDNRVSNDTGSMDGGAIYCSASQLSISNCAFTDNRVQGEYAVGFGGAVYAKDQSQLELANCILQGNVATRGGAIHMSGDSQLMLHNCVLSNNTASGGAYSTGGGIYLYESAAAVERCMITGNTAGRFGGGMYCADQSGDISLQNCLIAENSASYGGGAHFIGANEKSLRLQNCTITGNTSSEQGGGIYVGIPGGGSVSLDLSNTVLWGNGGGSFHLIPFDSFRFDVRHCNIQGLPETLEGNGNFDLDPLFATDDDYRLSNCSPCINTGVSSANVPETDLDGHPRVVGTRVDVGAFEYQLPSSDFDGDRIPDQCDVCPYRPDADQDDSNNDTVGDACDCDQNGVDDACDMYCSIDGCGGACGDSEDCNSNFIPDSCEGVVAPGIVHTTNTLYEASLCSGYIDPRAESTNGMDLDLGIDEIPLEIGRAHV